MFFSTTKLILRNFTEVSADNIYAKRKDSFFQRMGLSTILRSVGVFIFFIAHSPLEYDIQDYAKHIYCDTFGKILLGSHTYSRFSAPPRVCVLQLLCILTLFFSNLYDIQQSEIYKIVVSPTAEDVAIQPWLRKTIFRRYKTLSAYHTPQ